MQKEFTAFLYSIAFNTDFDLRIPLQELQIEFRANDGSVIKLDIPKNRLTKEDEKELSLLIDKNARNVKITLTIEPV